jgi:hypothetical protein
MILRLSDFVNEQDSNSPDGSEKTQAPVKSYVGKLKINWDMPDLAEEISHYDEKAKLEFYQHNITIGNKDIGKVAARSTKFFKYISEPFKKGHMETIPIVSEDGFDVNSIQNLMAYEFDNIIAGAYGRAYGDVLVKISDDLKRKGSLSLPAPIVIKFINFGETRTSAEYSYYLFSGNRIANLALQYNIPLKALVLDLVPSRRDVREFAQKAGATTDPAKFKKLLRRETGKETLDDLNARERFKIIQSLKDF